MPDPRRALIPGSFDPVTRGHLDVIRRAARLFDRLWVGVLDHPDKRACFTPDERVALIREDVAPFSNVEVVTFRGLTAHLADQLDADWIVRAVRAPDDVGYELAMAWANRRCGTREIETLLLPASHDVAFISSSLVREVARGGGRISEFVTPTVEAALREKFGTPAGG